MAGPGRFWLLLFVWWLRSSLASFAERETLRDGVLFLVYGGLLLVRQCVTALFLKQSRESYLPLLSAILVYITSHFSIPVYRFIYVTHKAATNSSSSPSTTFPSPLPPPPSPPTKLHPPLHPPHP